MDRWKDRWKGRQMDRQNNRQMKVISQDSLTNVKYPKIS